MYDFFLIRYLLQFYGYSTKIIQYVFICTHTHTQTHTKRERTEPCLPAWGRYCSIIHKQLSELKLALSRPWKLPWLRFLAWLEREMGDSHRINWKPWVEESETNFTRKKNTTEPRIEAAITTGEHVESRGCGTPTQLGRGSLSPDTVSPGAPPIWGHNQLHCLS